MAEWKRDEGSQTSRDKFRSARRRLFAEDASAGPLGGQMKPLAGPEAMEEGGAGVSDECRPLVGPEALAAASKRWGFDFERERPLSVSSRDVTPEMEWERLPLASAAPFYRGGKAPYTPVKLPKSYRASPPDTPRRQGSGLRVPGSATPAKLGQALKVLAKPSTGRVYQLRSHAKRTSPASTAELEAKAKPVVGPPKPVVQPVSEAKAKAVASPPKTAVPKAKAATSPALSHSSSNSSLKDFFQTTKRRMSPPPVPKAKKGEAAGGGPAPKRRVTPSKATVAVDEAPVTHCHYALRPSTLRPPKPHVRAS